jgi:Fe-S cluster assembly iron-binding protein IscA
MALDEPKESDSVYEVEGTKILFDKESEEYSKGFMIDLRESIFGKRIMINQLYGSAGGCR